MSTKFLTLSLVILQSNKKLSVFVIMTQPRNVNFKTKQIQITFLNFAKNRVRNFFCCNFEPLFCEKMARSRSRSRSPQHSRHKVDRRRRSPSRSASRSPPRKGHQSRNEREDFARPVDRWSKDGYRQVLKAFTSK